MTVYLTGYLRCDTADQAAKVQAALPEHIRLTREEPGCLTFDVTPTDDPLVWYVSESFVDRAAFDAHTARAKASDWGRESQGIPRDFQIEDR